MHFVLILFLLYLSFSQASSNLIEVPKSCTTQKRYFTLVPETYTATYLTTYITIEYVYCPFFPTFRCPRKIEKTRVITSLKTRLVESTIIKTQPSCCEGYKEIIGRENLCTPICEQDCQNGGICFRPDECICMPQYIGTTCEQDVDECANSNICDHSCTNSYGSYECSCDTGYYLDLDGSSCNEHILSINSFKATLKSAESVSLDWQLETEPSLEDLSSLIESISMNRITTSNQSTLIHLPIDRRSALFFNLESNSYYTFELYITTIHGDDLIASLSLDTPDQRVQCPNYYNIYHHNPCGEGSICLDSEDTPNYICECLPGYAQPDCRNINECNDNPCENGAVCVDGVNDYNCICPSRRFTGKNCGIEMSFCDVETLPCNGHGECIPGEEDYTCNCVTGYRGATCEHEVDFCSPYPCLNGGTCISGEDSAICECPSNYSGLICENLIDPCAGYSCNSGQCFVTQDREPVCSCTSRTTTGTRCEIECRDYAGDLCVCDVTTNTGACQEYCLEDTDEFYQINWTNTTRGDTIRFPCTVISSTLTGVVSRECLITSRWGDVNSTGCTAIPTALMLPIFPNCTSAIHLTKELWAYTTKPANTSLNSTSVELLFSLLKDLAEYSNQESCSFKMNEELLAILSSLVSARYISALHTDNKDRVKVFNTLRKIEEIITHLSSMNNITIDVTDKNIVIADGENIDYVSAELSSHTPSQTNDSTNYEIEFRDNGIVSQSISIPSEVIEDKGISPRLSVLVIKSTEGFNALLRFNTTSKNNEELISKIVSVKIHNLNQQFDQLTTPIRIGFSITDNDLKDISCVYLNKQGRWSTDGITLKRIHNNEVICNAYHLSLFAVIRNISDIDTTTQISTSSLTATISNSTTIHEFSIISLITIIYSFTISLMLALYIIVLSITRNLANVTKNDGYKLNTICMINTAIAHLITSLLIGLTILMQMTLPMESVTCFGIRATTQYCYLVIISAIITEFILGLIYLKFSKKDGKLPKINWAIAIALVICWSIPVIITLFTTIPLYNSYSILQHNDALRCAFLSADAAFYLVVSFFGLTFVIFLLLTSISLLFACKTGINTLNKKFIMKYYPRSNLLLLLHLLLVCMILPANFLLQDDVKTQIFNLHLITMVFILLLLMCYLERETFKTCFRGRDHSENKELATRGDLPVNENGDFCIDDDGYLRLQNEHYQSSSNFPYRSVAAIPSRCSNRDILLVPENFYDRTHSDGGLLDRDNSILYVSDNFQRNARTSPRSTSDSSYNTASFQRNSMKKNHVRELSEPQDYHKYLSLPRNAQYNHIREDSELQDCHKGFSLPYSGPGHQYHDDLHPHPRYYTPNPQVNSIPYGMPYSPVPLYIPKHHPCCQGPILNSPYVNSPNHRKILTTASSYNEDKRRGTKSCLSMRDHQREEILDRRLHSSVISPRKLENTLSTSLPSFQNISMED
ncbi:Sushi, von Willebrand factor type A, EGF and pentraxin domain-containing protein 1-like [Oopsacas minuta]|uniref:Sushi, von Willebrand factor type A, EGF and pentraxin domain-containing protein 1-like n=1 Tax=Oopsacas minuta TaxID=111878 RepID=A0AAV7JNM1_9METZ|nr:Sushi, von Willebrand factor type A, EGF and pentraxin domain-containing protein 1-like [Oopsacas minuta]